MILDEDLELRTVTDDLDQISTDDELAMCRFAWMFRLIIPVFVLLVALGGWQLVGHTLWKSEQRSAVTAQPEQDPKKTDRTSESVF